MKRGLFVVAVVIMAVVAAATSHESRNKAPVERSRPRPLDIVDFYAQVPVCDSLDEALDADLRLQAHPSLYRIGIPGCVLAFGHYHMSPPTKRFIAYDVIPERLIPAGKVAICVSNDFYPLRSAAYCSWAVGKPSEIHIWKNQSSAP